MGRADAIKRQVDRKAQGYGTYETYFNMEALSDLGIELFKSQEGDNFIAIVPPPDADAYFGYEIFPHFGVGPDDGKFLCPRMMKKGKCPLCEEYRRLKGDSDADQETMKTLNAFPPRYLFWVVDMTSAESEAKGVQLYDAPMTVNDGILAESRDKRSGKVLDISDPDSGSILAFTRVGKGKRSRYQAFSLEERDPLPQEWLDAVGEFEDTVVVKDYDYIHAAYFGAGSVEEEPSGSRVRRSRVRTPRETDSDDEQVDDAPPRRGRRSRTTREDRSVRETLDEVEEDLNEDEDGRLSEARGKLKERMDRRRESKK